MKRIVLLFSLALAILAPVYAQPKPPASAIATPSDPLKGLAKERDKMEGMTWYRHSTSPKYINSGGFYLYFGKEDNGRFTPLRLITRYYAEDWLFVNKAWAKADNVTVNFPQESKKLLGWERDHASGKIWEWSDVPVINPVDKTAVRTLANAKEVTVRFEGKQYYKDRTLTAQQLKALREVIAAYEAATGKPW